MNEFDRNIVKYSENICKNIDVLENENRGLLSQNILNNLRNLVEAIAQRIYSELKVITLNSYNDIVKSLDYVSSRGDLRFLTRFHDMLQSSVSHFTPDEDNSIRLMLKYHEWLIKIKEYAKKNFDLLILQNLEDYPWNQDNSLDDYYKKIATTIDAYSSAGGQPQKRYYIHKRKPFFVNGKIYYELTITSADDYSSKFDRFTAFTNKEIPTYYSIKLKFVQVSINVLNRDMPILIVDTFRVAIRPIELEDLSTILNMYKINTRNKEYIFLMDYLTNTGFSLVDIIDMKDPYYEQCKLSLLQFGKTANIVEMLDLCRSICKQKKSGYITLRYLLLRLRHSIMKMQINDMPNNWFSNLSLKNSCMPFEKMPFDASLTKHNPSFYDVLRCISSVGREHELLAHKIRISSEQNLKLFNFATEYEKLGEISMLVNSYNSKLPEKHRNERQLILDNKYIYINGYIDHCRNIFGELLMRVGEGVNGYINSMETWLDKVNEVDSLEKQNILKKMFSKSNISIIYGAAGTGKTTLIKHISNYFATAKKLFLANTNPATENLRRQIHNSNSDFSTIASSKKYINNFYDVVFIDECSTIDNRTMDVLLQQIKCKLLVLVGDVFQIQSVQFGNWFSLARYFMPNSTICELETPYRAENQELVDLWSKVRTLDCKIAELIANKGYSSDFDDSLFERKENDEIILCLNYDGLYGINNLNKFLQSDNPNSEFYWDEQIYKVGDPIIFSENNRFYPLIYNNLKGWIKKIERGVGNIKFFIEIPIALNELDVQNLNLELLDCDVKGHSIISFVVDNYAPDDGIEKTETQIVPFQVAYAISIHKAQGLEYNSVKVVISNQIEELITHNIFYTAITRARKNLKIFWTPETQQIVLEQIKPVSIKQDACILAGKFGLKMLNQVE